MISFDLPEGRFSLRSVAVVIHDGCVLIHRAEGDGFWALPGGRVEFLETSKETVVRELREELGLPSKIIRQLWYAENFFEYDAKKYHELASYFLVSLLDQPSISPEVDFEGIEESVSLIFRWVPLAKIGEYNLYPRFLRQGLINLPDAIQTIEINELNV